MTYFGFTQEQCEEKKALFTAKEINQQPMTWQKTMNQINEERKAITDFINQVILQEDFDVIMTGAGTSEFVGNSLLPYLNPLLKFKVKSFATTDITASPENYISKTKPTLLISYGRSGNSPESIGAVEAAEVVNPSIRHLFITCNRNGSLSKMAKVKDNCYAINLTDETHDQSFAMTSSFTNMYLATLLVFEKIETPMNDVIKTTSDWLANGITELQAFLNQKDFKRIVYLGSHSLKGIAQESALKMLELTSGKIVTMFDTPLGFRHGPKSIIDNDTLCVVMMSDDEYTRGYELDLIKEMSSQRKENQLLLLCNTPCDDAKELVNHTICINGKNKESVYCGLNYVVVAQTIAFFKALSLNITPDNPCPSGEVNRVVKGVTLYPYKIKA